MRTSRRVGIITLSVFGGFGLLLALLGFSVGPFAFLVLLGMTLLLLGAVGVVVGREWWALIRSRRLAAMLLAAGVLLTGVGTALTPPLPETVTAAAAEPTTAVPTTMAAPTTSAPATTDPVDTLIATARAGTALTALGSLEVKGRAPKTGYTRDQFGAEWADVDGNGCDTRNDILRRDLTGPSTESGMEGCVIVTGDLPGPYSDTDIAYLRGVQASSDVQIDHVVSLSDAWQKGAQQLDETRRTAFANDPLNLLAVDGGLNAQKSDSDAASWLPPSTGYRCAFVARQVAVKRTYQLWVTQAERGAIARVLAGCPDEPLPTSAAAAPPPATTDAPAPAPAAPAPAPAPANAPPPRRDVPPPAPAPAAAQGPFANCAAARAAGAAPVRVGDPGYAPRLDRDGDGVGCEN